MKAIDSHVHLMKFRPNEHVWVTDDMPELRHDFLPTDLDPLLTAAGFDSCIAVEAPRLPLENEWLVGLASQWPRIAAVVGWVDFRAHDIGTQLDQLDQHSIIKGAFATWSPMNRRDSWTTLPSGPGRAGIAELGRRHHVYELLVLPEQLHGAGLPDIRGGGHLAWRRPCRQPPRPAIRPGPRRAAGLTAIARCANVSVKLSALDFRARWHHWRPADIRPYLETACQLFNPSRLTIGSNWQVCLLSSSYQDSIGAVMDYASSLSASEQTDLRSGTAQRCCRI